MIIIESEDIICRETLECEQAQKSAKFIISSDGMILTYCEDCRNNLVRIRRRKARDFERIVQ